MRTSPSQSQSALIILLFSIISIVSTSFTPKDLLSTPDRGPAIPNPEGSLAVYFENTYHFSNNSKTGGIYLLPLKPNAKGKLIVNSTYTSSPVWLDNERLVYIVEFCEGSEIRTYDVESKKDEKVHYFDGTILDFKCIPVGGKDFRFVFSMKVSPNGEMNEASTPEALVYDRLWVRHWDEWITNDKNSLFSGTLKTHNDTLVLDEYPRNMLNGTSELHDLESPIPPWGGENDFTVSKDLLAFVAKDPHLNPATNTAAHVYVARFDDRKYLEKINRGPGASSSPVWSPDGKYLAYLEMRVRGYESDRISLWGVNSGNRLVVFKWETHDYYYLTETWDRSPSDILWSKDGKTLYLTTEEYGRRKLFQIPFEKGETPKLVVAENSIISVYWAGNDLLLSQSSLVSPSILQLYSTANSSLIPLSTPSFPLSRKSVQEFWFQGFHRHPVHGFFYLPENFDRKKKYPLAFMIHGGPQGAWEDSWSKRWNPAVFANDGEGWIVAAINPTGSTGYGQEFTDAIAGNWGTKPCMSPPTLAF
jgi:dipeptidyl aminopeptidase/acylaminoacyl peptidase